jgi:exopolyphosphatase/guanosine-5'-triphosphate,3'-diphosphate pyrophosphatase
VEAVAALVSGRRQSRRRAISGLNPDRADSIVGGAQTVLVMMDMLDAEDLMVSGMGLREGIALSSLSLEPQPLPQIRRASVAALSGRFGTWDEGRAWRRVALMDLLSDALLPDASGKARERMRHAATLLDIGRSVDYYRRHEHTADIVLTADLDGFTHRALALLAAVIARSGEPGVRIQRYRPLVGSQDRETVTREATLLELADEVEHRLGPGDLARVRCDDRGRIVALTAPVFDPWKSERLGARFRKSFRKKLEITTPTDSISQGSE